MTVIKNMFSIEVSHPGGYKLSVYEVSLPVKLNICVAPGDMVTSIKIRLLIECSEKTRLTM